MTPAEEVATFRSLEEARVAVGYLQANGVDASLADAHMHSLFGSALMGGKHRVIAPRDQVVQARRLLDEVAANGSRLTTEEENDRPA